jgi:cytochrome c oxidase subunit I
MTANISLPPVAPEATEHGHGERRWQDYFTFNTDHKVIGIQYMVMSFFFYLVGGLLAEGIRTELATPDPDFVDPALYNSMFTMHATIMIFLWIVPAGTGAFANFLIPLMIGARDMAFPRLNAVAFWMLPPAGVMLVGSFFLESGAAQAGWTSYPPLSLLTGKPGEAIWILSLLLGGTSSILGGINFMTTILKMRVPSMKMMQMPLFCWAMIATSALMVIATPILAGALILLSFDLLAGTAFFNPTAHVLVLFPPSGVHYGAAVLWDYFGGDSNSLPKADFWLWGDRLFQFSY